MLVYYMDARDGAAGECGVCCCQSAKMAPGETNKWQLNYASWSMPIGGYGLTVNTDISITKVQDAVASSGNLPPIVTFAGFTATLNTPLAGDLTTFVVDPESDHMTFAAMPLYGPQHGTLEVNENGSFTYTPLGGFTGLDRFFFKVKDPTNKAVVGEALIGVGTASAPVESLLTPEVTVDGGKVRVSPGYQSVEFPIAVSPAATPGDIYRVNVRQQAMDCSGTPFYHVGCFDLFIQSC